MSSPEKRWRYPSLFRPRAQILRTARNDGYPGRKSPHARKDKGDNEELSAGKPRPGRWKGSWSARERTAGEGIGKDWESPHERIP